MIAQFLLALFKRSAHVLFMTDKVSLTVFLLLFQDLFAIATDQPFRFPSTFTFVLRAFSTLEGTLSL